MASLSELSPTEADLERADLEKDHSGADDREAKLTEKTIKLDRYSLDGLPKDIGSQESIQKSSNDHNGASPERSNDKEKREDEDFEVKFDGEADPWNPKNRSTLRKWFVVFIIASSSLCVTCASALYTSTYDQMEAVFHISREVATLGLTTYVCGLGLGPMFLSPLSEFYGRRIIYICSFGMFVIWMIPCAVAQNIGTMLVVRFIDGLAGSAFLSVAGGTVMLF